jgi:septum site-determining protein MinD
MMSIADVEEVLGLKDDRRDPGVPGRAASNKGEPVILDGVDAGQAYDDAVARLLGESRPMRFTQVEKKGFSASCSEAEPWDCSIS